MKCPKCSYERGLGEAAPEWQCPSCKVAYAKAGLSNAAVASPSVVNPAATRAASATETAALVAQIEEEEKLSLAASGQKIAIYCILINMLLQGVMRSRSLPTFVVLILSCLVGLYALVGVVRICSGLGKSQDAKLGFMVTSFVPLANVVTLVYLSVKATRALREAGWRVGLLGAKP